MHFVVSIWFLANFIVGSLFPSLLKILYFNMAVWTEIVGNSLFRYIIATVIIDYWSVFSLFHSVWRRCDVDRMHIIITQNKINFEITSNHKRASRSRAEKFQKQQILHPINNWRNNFKNKFTSSGTFLQHFLFTIYIDYVHLKITVLRLPDSFGRFLLLLWLLFPFLSSSIHFFVVVIDILSKVKHFASAQDDSLQIKCENAYVVCLCVNIHQTKRGKNVVVVVGSFFVCVSAVLFWPENVHWVLMILRA